MACKLIILVLFVIMPLTVSAGWSDPSDFDECILKHMKGVTSDVAAKLIYRSCLEKFPPKPQKKPKKRELTHLELAKLTGRASLSGYGNDFGGTIYNGNKNITVTEVSISVATTISGKKTTRVYKDYVNISPQAAEYFTVKIIPGDKETDHPWFITGAKGY